MNPFKTTNENRNFYFFDLGISMCSELFVTAVIRSIQEITIVDYPIHLFGECCGNISIDTSSINTEESGKRLISIAHNGVFANVSIKMKGQTSDEVDIVQDGFKFSFKINGYGPCNNQEKEAGCKQSKNYCTECVCHFVDFKISLLKN